MPPSFPRLDLPSPSSLTHVLSTLLTHSSTSLLLQQLEKDGLTGEQEELVCKRVLELWVKKAEERLKGNLSVEGVGWREWEEKAQALAPLDTQLSTRLSNLSRTVDELTEDVVISRRELPTRRAEALRARDEVVDALREKEAEERERVRKGGFADEEGGGMGGVEMERKEEVAKVLQTALRQAGGLAETLPAQVAAVQEQHELVTQLRSMPP